VIVTSVDARSETAQMQYDVGTALESQVESAKFPSELTIPPSEPSQ
jgi:hypothetical protein